MNVDNIDKVKFTTGAAEGADGAATSTDYSMPVSGEVVAVYVAYKDSPPAATTDFILAGGDDPAEESIIALADAATDIKIYPARILEQNDGTDITGIYTKYIVHGRLKATIAQANAGDYCEVTAWIKS